MTEIHFNADHPVAGHVLAYRDLPDNRFAYVIPIVLRQAQICIGDRWTCEHRYTYTSPVKALEAFIFWDIDEEPTGWHRHQPSNRRRPDGNPAQEYIRE